MEDNVIKDIKYNKKRRKRNRDVQSAVEFVKKNLRYFVAGVVFVTLVVIAALFMNPKDIQTGGLINGEESQTDGLQENANQAVNDLIQNYYTAYAAGDVETLMTLATPISEREQGYISLFSQYVESYQNMRYYSQAGLDEGSYLVNVYVDVKFTGVDTLAPGLDFFYVRTNEAGMLYIDNLYSSYNLKNKDNALDTEVYALIQQFRQREDVIALYVEVQTQFDTVVATDENLAAMIDVTIPEAISAWIVEWYAQNPDLLPETSTPETPSTETPPVTETPETEVPPVTEEPESEIPEPETPESETPDVVSFPEGTVITIKETLNVRGGMSTDTEKVGTVYQGEKVTVVMSYAEGWTKVKFNGDKTGYIRSDLLQ